MRGKMMFLTGLAAGFVLGSRAGREKYEEIRTNAKKLWESPSVQEAAGVAQAQATKLYSEGKDKLQSSKLGEKLHATAQSSGRGSAVATPTESLGEGSTVPTESLAGSSASKSTGTV